MKKLIFALVIVTVFCIQAYAAEEKIGQGDFVSNTMVSIFDKLRSYASGDKQLIPMDRKSWGLDEGRKPDMTERELDKVTIRSTGSTSAVNPQP